MASNPQEQNGRSYTQAKLARALGITRQAVCKGLAGVEADSTGGWGFGALPMDWQLEITRRGVMRGYQDGEDFLAKLPEVWRAPLSWGEVAEHERAKAERLQKALARPLELREQGAQAAELEAAGLNEFQAVFGYRVSARHWRRLFGRTIERDAGAENWQRLEIYLDDRAFLVKRGKTRQEFEYDHRELGEVLGRLEFENRRRPTAKDRQDIWHQAFTHFEDLAAETGGKDEVRVKQSLVEWLFGAFPELCATAGSLRRRFEEKLKVWTENGRQPESLADGRDKRSGNHTRPEEDFEGDFEKWFERATALAKAAGTNLDTAALLKAREELEREGALSVFFEDLWLIAEKTLAHDGNVSLAYRLLRLNGKLSQRFCEKYPYSVRSAKSEVPRRVRAVVSALAAAMQPYREGPQAVRASAPYFNVRGDCKPGDYYVADDVTINHYWKVRREDGSTEVIRGECLVVCDKATGYMVGHLLIAGHYNSEHIRLLFLRVHDSVGLPRKGLILEHGVWNSELVNALEKAGISVRRAAPRNPRGKAILEGGFRILQERMRCIPGFIGFNERTERYEREQELLSKARRGDPEALAQIPTQEEMVGILSEEFEKFNNEPQNGQSCNGESPAEVWERAMSWRPLRKLPEDCRHKLYAHEKEAAVTSKGIILEIRGRSRAYYNGGTGVMAALGKRAIAYYNLEDPEHLVVTDMDRQRWFTVTTEDLPATSATQEELAAANRRKRAHMAPAKALFGMAKHRLVVAMSNDNEHSQEDKDAGRLLNQEAQRQRERKTQQAQRDRKDRQATIKRRDELMERLRRREEAEQVGQLGAGAEEPEGINRLTQSRERDGLRPGAIGKESI